MMEQNGFIAILLLDKAIKKRSNTFNIQHIELKDST